MCESMSVLPHHACIEASEHGQKTIPIDGIAGATLARHCSLRLAPALEQIPCLLLPKICYYARLSNSGHVGMNAQICKIMNEHVDDVIFLKICFESNKDMVSDLLCVLLLCELSVIVIHMHFHHWY